MAQGSSNIIRYPPALATYVDVVANPLLFLDTLRKLHTSMGTKFKFPIIGGKEIDLHRLFVEVTYRGGIAKILEDKQWKAVTASFNFPVTATNASFVLRKYYYLLLYDYEQIYLLNARESSQSVLVLQDVANKQPRLNTAYFPLARSRSSSTSCEVLGIIDGKFESGYLISVMIGSETLKGVLYQPSLNLTSEMAQHLCAAASINDNVIATPVVQRRKRRKKSEIKRRDPAHPKPNRSGYNFFFAEQHARLKPLHPGKDRDISRMIGVLWTALNESDRAVYQDKAISDKERYKLELLNYNNMKTGTVISDAVPLQQRLPTIPDVNINVEAGGDSDHSLDNDSGSSKSDSGDDSETAPQTCIDKS